MQLEFRPSAAFEKQFVNSFKSIGYNTPYSPKFLILILSLDDKFQAANVTLDQQQINKKIFQNNCSYTNNTKTKIFIGQNLMIKNSDGLSNN